jgi:hypothetical protein
MAAFVVMEKGRAPDGSPESLAFVRDGFHWPAFLLPVLWLLWHRLWIEAALTFALTVALSAALQMLDFRAYAPVATILIAIFFGLEGAALRVRALARRGWREWGVVEAPRLEDAELRYAGAREAEEEPADEVPGPPWAHRADARRLAAPSSIGLVPYGARS